MNTRRYSEGKSVPLGERWFTTSYAVPIFSNDAILRWLKAKASVINHAMEPPYRLFRVRTLSQMEFVNAKN